MESGYDASDKLQKVIEAHREYTVGRLEVAQRWAASAPYIKSRLDELDALSDLLSLLPPDIREELAPTLLQQEQESFVEFQFNIPNSPGPNVGKLAYLSTSGTISITEQALNPIVRSRPNEQWARDVRSKLQAIADARARKSEIPQKLKALHAELPPLFSAMLESYDKSKIDLAGQDNALQRMRYLLEQVWGNLVAQTRENCGGRTVPPHAEFASTTNREQVASCLGTGRKVVLLRDELKNLYDLHRTLSSRGKNSIINDPGLVDECFTVLMLGIESILNWMEL